jgi:hypothetical protein
MKLLPEHYLQAATERVRQAQFNADSGYHALAMDTAGRAVECRFRAYFFKRNGLEAKLESAHNTPELFKASGLKTIALDARQRGSSSDDAINRYKRELEADIADIHQRWTNNLRYASEDRLRAFLKQRKLHRGIKGDFLKDNSRKLIEATRRVVNEGVERWSRSVKK